MASCLIASSSLFGIAQECLNLGYAPWNQSFYGSVLDRWRRLRSHRSSGGQVLLLIIEGSLCTIAPLLTIMRTATAPLLLNLRTTTALLLTNSWVCGQGEMDVTDSCAIKTSHAIHEYSHASAAESQTLEDIGECIHASAAKGETLEELIYPCMQQI